MLKFYTNKYNYKLNYMNYPLLWTILDGRFFSNFQKKTTEFLIKEIIHFLL